jgi:hypothetical protein
MNMPFILFSDVILFTKVYQVGDRFCSEKLERIDDIDLSMR